MVSVKDDQIDTALARVDEIYRSGQGVTGGYRVQIREVLAGLFEQGVVHGSWEPKPELAPAEPAVAPRSAWDHVGRAGGGHRVSEVTESHEDAWGELRGWWEQTAVDEIGGLIAKMEEYGGLHRATDLTDIGLAMNAAGVRPDQGRDSVSQSQELGAYFYLVGKFARWSAAIREGRPVSDDTLHDIAIYTRMVQRIRAVGGWPI